MGISWGIYEKPYEEKIGENLRKTLGRFFVEKFIEGLRETVDTIISVFSGTISGAFCAHIPEGIPATSVKIPRENLWNIVKEMPREYFRINFLNNLWRNC